jgi:hypothetical protein
MSPVKTLRVPGPLRHQPRQTPGEGFFERLPGEGLLLRGMQRHHPARVFDVPPAIAAAGGDRSPEGVLQGAGVSGRIDAGIRNRASEVSRQGPVPAGRSLVQNGAVHGHYGDRLQPQRRRPDDS